MRIFAIALSIYLAFCRAVNAFPLIQIKSGGDFTNYHYITQEVNETTSIVNFANVSVIRKLGDKNLLVDGKININFRTKEERETFLKEYRDFVNPPEEEKTPISKIATVASIIGLSVCTIILGVAYYRTI